MRKLKLQMQISLDGFVATKDDSPVNFNWDDELKNHAVANLENVDSILIGHKTAEGFIPYWASKAEDLNDPEYRVGKALTDIPKVVFSRSATISKWPNATMATGDLVEQVNNLKKQSGANMIVYGGVDFVSALITNQLIDEYHLLVQPTALGSGRPIFKQDIRLKLVNSTTFSSGVVLNQYEPA